VNGPISYGDGWKGFLAALIVIEIPFTVLYQIGKKTSPTYKESIAYGNLYQGFYYGLFGRNVTAEFSKMNTGT